MSRRRCPQPPLAGTWPALLAQGLHGARSRVAARADPGRSPISERSEDGGSSSGVLKVVALLPLHAAGCLATSIQLCGRVGEVARRCGRAGRPARRMPGVGGTGAGCGLRPTSAREPSRSAEALRGTSGAAGLATVDWVLPVVQMVAGRTGTLVPRWTPSCLRGEAPGLRSLSLGSP